MLLGWDRRVLPVFRRFCRLRFADRCALGETRNAQVLRVPPESVKMKNDGLTRAPQRCEIDHATPGEFLRGRAAPDFSAAPNRLGWQIGFDAMRDHIDDAADGIAAVEERGGTAD